jgi:hypothetical protein
MPPLRPSAFLYGYNEFEKISCEKVIQRPLPLSNAKKKHFCEKQDLISFETSGDKI